MYLQNEFVKMYTTAMREGGVVVVGMLFVVVLVFSNPYEVV